jgi:hypothetical protein
MSIYHKFLILLVLTFANAKVNAAIFGKNETLHGIYDNGKKIIVEDGNINCYLGFKTSGYYFLAGLFLKDDGYILIDQANSDSYFPLNKSDIEFYQKNKILPNPLPTYKVPLFEYLLGFSLWIIIIGSILYYGTKRIIFGNDNDPIPDEEQTFNQ